jgi:membrane protein
MAATAALSGTFRFARKVLRDFVDDECPTLAGSLSYYTVFSLPPFLVLLLLIVGAVLDPADVRGALEVQIESLVGASGGEIARGLLQQAENPLAGSVTTAVVGGAALLLGATGAFLQLQAALNRVFEVKPDPAQGGVQNFVAKRAFALVFVLGVAFFLLVSLVVSATVSVVGEHAAGLLPGNLSEPLVHAVHLAFAFAVTVVMFATLLKFLPDARIAWSDAWVGAVFTTALFLVGKFAIGLYLGRSQPGQAYGAAASLAVLLVWIYYASMILLLGAEFTQTWAERRGGRVAPEPGAVKVREEEQRGEAAPART